MPPTAGGGSEGVSSSQDILEKLGYEQSLYRGLDGIMAFAIGYTGVRRSLSNTVRAKLVPVCIHTASLRLPEYNAECKKTHTRKNDLATSDQL